MEVSVGGPGKVRPTFVREGDRDYVELKIIGDPNTVIEKVTPAHVQRWPREWEAYQQGKTEVEIKGTPLTDVPGIDRGQAMAYKLNNVRTAEELADLDDAACRGLGMGAMTHRKAAQMLLKLNALQAAQVDDEPKRRGRPPKSDTPDDAA